jgi:2-(1,2-epoxy-1,2-dihydrophenyl)acetyl-CoA isomerase
MTYKNVILDKKERIATLTLNRPEKLNAFSMEMITEAREAIREVETDAACRVLIVTGIGRGFSAGLDMDAFDELDNLPHREVLDFMHGWGRLYNLSKPTIAAINGPAVGIGLTVAMMCDLRIASERSRFSMAFVKLGIIPGMGSTYILPRLVGQAKATELMLLGETFTAQDAYRMGLLTKVTTEAEVMESARDLAQYLAEGPPLAQELIKRAVHLSFHNSFVQQTEMEALSDYTCFRSEDHKEGVRAFREKRAPRFLGQ